MDGEWEEADANAEESPGDEELGHLSRVQAQTPVHSAATALISSDHPVEHTQEANAGLPISASLPQIDRLDDGRTPASPASLPLRASHSTVDPVDIVSRKPVRAASNGLPAHINQPSPAGQRTPSPGGLSSPDPTGVDPMTPTNDAGPFVLDGSGKSKRSGPIQISPMGTLAGTSAAAEAGLVVDAITSTPNTTTEAS